ncbi:MAG: hypothetical protein K8R21_15835 [Leptospira sp.]|nr:hypothetical protein [Leptospira sp.]
MIYHIIGFLLSFTATFFWAGNRFSPAVYFQENWAWNKSGDYGMDEDRRLKTNPKNILNGYKSGNRLFFFHENKAVQADDTAKTEIPLLGRGFLKYYKIGKTISYFSGDNELLWEKNYKSYPRPDLTGDLILLVSGDNNQVLTIDINGNPSGIRQIDGRFLTDISFSYNGSFLIFSGGESARLDKKGNSVYSTVFEDKSILTFNKSSALSPNGEFAAIHTLIGESDFISLLDKNGKILHKTRLEQVYPHKLYIGISDNGELLVNLPEKIILFGHNNKQIFLYEKKNREGNYQVAHSTGNFFAASADGRILILDTRGNLLKNKQVHSWPVRAIPSGETNSFFIETQSEIISFRKLD